MNLGFNPRAVAGALLCAIALAPVTARAAEEHRGFMVYLQGGGYSPVADLTEDGTASFKTGFVVGGGVGYRFNRYLALRGSLNYARTEAEAARRTARHAVNGMDVDRLLYDADLQLRYPTERGFSPYVFAGGGAVTISPDVDGVDSFTKGAGKFGIGFSYDFRDSGVSLFAEGTGWVYGFDRYDFDKTQVDIAWTAGIAYRFGL
jgi:Outer membrane protein beta-barrel domain